MHIRVRLFAAYREAVGAPTVDLELDGEATPARAWERLRDLHPALDRFPGPAFAVGDRYVPADYPLRDGDEVTLIPPVSGGSVHVDLVESPIDVDRLLRRVRHPNAGAVVLFLGTVRDNAEGPHVRYLDYEAYDRLARAEMDRIAEEVTGRWPVLGVALEHRVGRLEVGEVSVAVAVSAPHRREAFEAGRFAIDTLKTRVPIWKKEVWEGGSRWVGAEPEGERPGERVV
jgi:molybdopterin synthase catalytic subunit/molybdopterin converting factor small subunit